MIDRSQVQHLIGQELHTRDGDKVGTIGQVFVDDHDGEPEWVTVNTGLFGSNESFVPLAEARLSEGGALVVPYTKAQIKSAPDMDESAHLTEAEERALYEHYNVAATGTDDDTDASNAGRHQSEPDTRTATGVSGRDQAMTRSEERLRVGTEQVETGRARLRKWVETEHQSVDVPIRREKAQLVTEPIDDTGEASLADAPIGEGEHEIVLTEERPVVSKETVALERVALNKHVEQDVEQVDQDVRKERIAVDGDVDDDMRGDIQR
jgi:uncharacterized protein (TIGR02271 family)